MVPPGYPRYYPFTRVRFADRPYPGAKRADSDQTDRIRVSLIEARSYVGLVKLESLELLIRPKSSTMIVNFIRCSHMHLI